MAKTVLILGASGKIGRYSAAAFRDAGWQVRSYDRNTGDMTRAAQGVDLIVNGLNPPGYHNWPKLIPEITRQVIAAAKASGATVIVPGNVYNFGATPGIWSEDTPQNAATRKGRVRIQMEKSYRDSGVKTIILRAGNFIAPDRVDDVMSLFYLRPIAKGQVMSPGDPDALQANCYVPDWARAAVALAEKPDQLQVFEDIPFPGLTFSASQLRDMLQDILQRPLKLVKFPWMFFKIASPFWELAREIGEMRYLWSTSHQLSDKKFKLLLPDFQPTPLAEVIKGTLPPEVYPNQTVPGNRPITLA